MVQETQFHKIAPKPGDFWWSCNQLPQTTSTASMCLYSLWRNNHFCWTGHIVQFNIYSAVKMFRYFRCFISYLAARHSKSAATAVMVPTEDGVSQGLHKKQKQIRTCVQVYKGKTGAV